MTRFRLLILALVLSLIAAVAHARIGGGDSYSGSSSSSSSSDSSSDSDDSSGSDSSNYSSGGSSGGSSGTSVELDGCGVAAVFIVFGVLFLMGFIASATQERNEPIVRVDPSASQTTSRSASMSALRNYDPNFSEIVFADFCYSLFAKLYDAVGRGRVDDLSPYVSAGLREGLKRHAPAGLTGITDIVIGSCTVTHFYGLPHPTVKAEVEFEANYVEHTGAASRRWYVRERWTLERARDILSPAPDKARADHCPKCGAALQTRTDGACLHCGTIFTSGTFQWFVGSIRSFEMSERPRSIGGSGVEAGTNRQTVYQTNIGMKRQAFVDKHPGFSWDDFLARVRHVNLELQNAWTARDWRRARPYETEALFQTHRYWIDEYLRQGMRNVVDDFAIGEIEVVKLASDAFYDAITVRIFASGHDYTVDENDKVVGGAKYEIRRWSEYWTFIRGRAGASADARVCPNCGGPLAEGQTAICEYCGGKNTTGEFPWVLSRIEQDEAYGG